MITFAIGVASGVGIVAAGLVGLARFVAWLDQTQ